MSTRRDGGTNSAAGSVVVGVRVAGRSKVSLLAALLAVLSALVGCAVSTPPRTSPSRQSSWAYSVAVSAHRTSVPPALAACGLSGAAPGGPPAGTAAAGTAAAQGGCPVRVASAPAAIAHEVCGEVFPAAVLLGWGPTTVGQLRAYQYGGPIARHPLTRAFPGQAADQPAAWCLLRAGSHSSTLWGTIASGQHGRAITVSGPGADTYRGLMTQPPRVP